MKFINYNKLINRYIANILISDLFNYLAILY